MGTLADKHPTLAGKRQLDALFQKVQRVMKQYGEVVEAQGDLIRAMDAIYFDRWLLHYGSMIYQDLYHLIQSARHSSAQKSMVSLADAALQGVEDIFPGDASIEEWDARRDWARNVLYDLRSAFRWLLTFDDPNNQTLC